MQIFSIPEDVLDIVFSFLSFDDIISYYKTCSVISPHTFLKKLKHRLQSTTYYTSIDHYYITILPKCLQKVIIEDVYYKKKYVRVNCSFDDSDITVNKYFCCIHDLFTSFITEYAVLLDPSIYIPRLTNKWTCPIKGRCYMFNIGWTPPKVKNFTIGDRIDAMDGQGIWYEAMVKQIEDGKILVGFCGWGEKWDVWIDRSSPMMVPLRTFTKPWRNHLKQFDWIDIKIKIDRLWYRVQIIEICGEEIEYEYPGSDMKGVTNIHSDDICPAGIHSFPRTYMERMNCFQQQYKKTHRDDALLHLSYYQDMVYDKYELK